MKSPVEESKLISGRAKFEFPCSGHVVGILYKAKRVWVETGILPVLHSLGQSSGYQEKDYLFLVFLKAPYVLDLLLTKSLYSKSWAVSSTPHHLLPFFAVNLLRVHNSWQKAMYMFLWCFKKLTCLVIVKSAKCLQML